MSRYLFLTPLLAFLVSACFIASKSGEAPEPISSIPLATSEAGVAALSGAPLDPDSCEGVLGSPPDTHTLKTRSLTRTVQSSEQQIESMCSATYETSTVGDPFLSAALIRFDSDEPAIARYEMIKEGFVVNNLPISELNSADEDLLDHVSVLIDSDGMGRVIALRKNNWLVTISIGPTTDVSLWTAGDAQMIGESIIDRVQK